MPSLLTMSVWPDTQTQNQEQIAKLPANMKMHFDLFILPNSLEGLDGPIPSLGIIANL